MNILVISPLYLFIKQENNLGEIVVWDIIYLAWIYVNVNGDVKCLPVDRYVVLCTVNYFDNKRISISGFHSWPWKFPIYCEYVVGSAQPLHWRILNLFQSIIEVLLISN